MRAARREYGDAHGAPGRRGGDWRPRRGPRRAHCRSGPRAQRVERHHWPEYIRIRHARRRRRHIYRGQDACGLCTNAWVWTWALVRRLWNRRCYVMRRIGRYYNDSTNKHVILHPPPFLE